MKTDTVTTYTCDICGKSSTDRTEIERCEANVKKPEFGPGHRFSFWAGPHTPGGKRFVSGGIIERFDYFEKGTHTPMYLATCTLQDGSLIKGHLVSEWIARKNDKDKK